jgi:N-carbamoyl-L-amino-acid hydrolase
MDIVIDPDRLRDTFETYAAFGATDDGGLDRLALTDADRSVRDQFCSDLNSVGLDVTVDEVGNIFGRQTGSFPDDRPVLVGSHLDSQPNGGQYDGQLGVVVALETVRAIESQSIKQNRPVKIVNWTNEEGARFNLSPLGSGVYSGWYDTDTALAETDSTGATVAEALTDIGYKGEIPCEPHDTSSYLELHIEQGPVLDTLEKPVGVVDAGVGMSWLEVTISGTANHAGTTPMHERQDPLATAVRVIDEIQGLPVEFSEDVVLTTGEFHVHPDVINVIPDRVVFTIDVRTPDDETRTAVLERIDRLLSHETTNRGTTYETAELLSIGRKSFSESVAQHSIAACKTEEIPFTRLVSGAGHDAMCLTDVTDAGLLFVPSVDGVSHTPQEYTRWNDVLAGARVFAETTCRLVQD